LEIREHYTDTAGAIDHVLVYAISWGFGSRRAFAILAIADCLSLTAAPFTPP
jgi:TnpA family transposase